jgi:hypothetical protein
MSDFSFDRWILESILKDNVCLIKYTRITGGISKMKCTLKDDYIPEYTGDEQRLKIIKNIRIENDIIAVWNIDKKGWRCFNLDGFTDLEVIDGTLPV